jgi:hypothetical protein
VGPRAILDGCGKSRSHWDSILGPSIPSKSLYRLSHPGPLTNMHLNFFSIVMRIKYSTQVPEDESCLLLNCVVCFIRSDNGKGSNAH